MLHHTVRCSRSIPNVNRGIRNGCRGLHLPRNYRFEVESSIENYNATSTISNLRHNSWDEKDINEFQKINEKNRDPPRTYVKGTNNLLASIGWGCLSLIPIYYAFHINSVDPLLLDAIPLTASFYYYREATISRDEFLNRYHQIKDELDKLKEKQCAKETDRA